MIRIANILKAEEQMATVPSRGTGTKWKQTISGLGLGGWGGHSCPKRPGILCDALMTGVSLLIQVRRGQLRWFGEKEQVLRTPVCVRGQLRSLVFKKSQGFQRRAHRNFRRSVSLLAPGSRFGA